MCISFYTNRRQGQSCELESDGFVHQSWAVVAKVDGTEKFTFIARIPFIITNQRYEAKNLSRQRRSRWISAISRRDLTDDILKNGRVCGRHLTPSFFWGHTKVESCPRNMEKVAERGQRTRDPELIKRKKRITEKKGKENSRSRGLPRRENFVNLAIK